MLASRISRIERRGIVLVLVLAMLGLLALIGVTFATFSSQARINARNYAQSVLEPQADELIDYALSQLIGDTEDVRSTIRGHSMLRDMYGSDAQNNGYLTGSPLTGAFLATSITPVQQTVTASPQNNFTFYNVSTNISASDASLYGYNFNRWIIRIAYTGPTATGFLTPVNQTFEVLHDSGFSSAGGARTFLVSPIDQTTTLNNPSLGTETQTALGQFANPPATVVQASNLSYYPFILDGRWLRAFNGTGATSNAVYGNFRYNGGVIAAGANATAIYPGSPRTLSMDEDYDACDLENWFLAMQSADGQVIIPSFHRPGVIRYDPNGSANAAASNDWQNVNPLNNTNVAAGWADSASRILRPRNYDGHDAATFPDLVPSASTGKINYDVDNDGDGVTDSVWLDLGYPARRDSRGILYKPLFAFMVIGLNGRIPLNTAGNLASGGSHATHLGNSVSEVDPTYALQNANLGPVLDYDPFNTMKSGLFPPTSTLNTQGDNTMNATGTAAAPVDVRLTQLRNILAGTRPNPTPLVTQTSSSLNGDLNFVTGSWGSTDGYPYYLPNGVADLYAFGYTAPGSITASGPAPDSIFATDMNGNPVVYRGNGPVPGRWGEAQSIPGGIIAPNGTPSPPAVNGYLNLVTNTYHNSVRAGYSFDVTDILNGNPRDAADDNFNLFDPYPVTPVPHSGEVNDQDFYDAAGALLLPVDRMRRFVTPADINGTGSVHTWQTNANNGADRWGRVVFSSYFRPPGAPGVIGTSYTISTTGAMKGSMTPATGVTMGEVYYPSSNSVFYTAGPNPANGPNPYPNASPITFSSTNNYLPDLTNNPFHGFEFYKLPSTTTTNPMPPPATIPSSAQGLGGMLFDTSTNAVPTSYPTYNTTIATNNADGLNDADEMNLYQRNPLLDSPYGPSDLEWLYRQGDVDSQTLSSRLAYLAPISFTNTIDGLRRRRLFALDSWEMNNFVWANDNPGGVFPNNSSFATGQSASFQALSTNLTNNLKSTTNLYIPTPSLAQRDKKINLNYPLPVSNNPYEPVRLKWINDTYQLLKRVLPPRATDTAEELVQLGQFVVNIIDFRDPDGTITIWTNPDVTMSAFLAGTVPTVSLTPNTGTLVQYGVEYNPVAINEVLAYGYQYYSGSVLPAYRFNIELVNTLTQTGANAYSIYSGASPVVPDASILDLGGFEYTPGDPYSGGAWDLVFTSDDPASRPDPYRGDLVTGGVTYGLIPLNRDSFSTTYTDTAGTSHTLTSADVSLVPLSSTGVPPVTAVAPPAPPTDLFYVLGNAAPSVSGVPYEYNGNTKATGPANVYTTGSPTPASAPSLVQNLATSFDPMNGSAPTFLWRPGVLPGVNGTIPGATAPTSYTSKIPPLSLGSNATKYYWVCLRRPANPFAPVGPDPITGLINPMVVVDSMRFPYSDGTVTAFGTIPGVSVQVPLSSKSSSKPVQVGQTNAPGNAVYSAQRFQPYRGGHAVPVTGSTVDTRYGYTEQIVAPSSSGPTPPSLLLGTQGIYYYSSNTAYYATNEVFHTLGIANEQNEPWDYFPFNDRDFTSVAELMMVPGCPPGLFTKQFVEFAPGTYASNANSGLGVFPTTAPSLTPPVTLPTSVPTASAPATASTAFTAATITTNPTPPPPTITTPGVAHTFPYLVDNFFYTGASLPLTFPATSTSTSPTMLGSDTATKSVNTAASDGWFKMFDFFEVPTQAIGGIGPVAQGTNFDWARQDMKPGMLNLNLIIDEEVFFSVLGKHNTSFSQTLLNSMQIPRLSSGITLPLGGGYPQVTNGTMSTNLNSPVPLVVSSVDANGSPAFVYPIAAYNQGAPGIGSGVTAVDPIQQSLNSGLTPVPPSVDSRLKAAFVEFLWLRHGGSGYLFGHGSGGVSQNSIIPPVVPPSTLPTGASIGVGVPADRPFRSLSYPDIDYTIMRPSTLPPSVFSNPQPNSVPSLSLTPPMYYTGDPGVRNANLYPGYLTGGIPTGTAAYPPAIPVRRLFQVPDFTQNSTAVATPLAYSSNAGDTGDPYINDQIPANPDNTVTGPIPAPGALPSYFVSSTGPTFTFNNEISTTNGTTTTLGVYPGITAGGSATGATALSPASLYLGKPTSSGGVTTLDNKQHPFWRIEMMQRVMNLTTVRTHQYAVWITIGFFTVTRQGDIGMIASANPNLAYDILGPEVDALNGKNTRYRGFYLVDRLQVPGFDPGSPGQFRAAVTYRKRIQ